MTKKVETKEEKKSKDAWLLSKDLPHLSKIIDAQLEMIEGLKREIDGTNDRLTNLESDMIAKMNSHEDKHLEQNLMIDAIKQRAENLTDSMNQILKTTYTKMNELEIAVKRDVSKKYVKEAVSAFLEEIKKKDSESNG